MAITGTQIKAARALLEMDQSELAQLASVNINTIRNMEACGASIVSARVNTLVKVQRALEFSGIIFIDPNGNGAGVRLKGD